LPAGLSTVQNDRVNKLVSKSLTLSGRVMSGVGQGAGFTRLAWVREKILSQCGIDPFPGTLNLSIETDTDLGTWRELCAKGGRTLAAPNTDHCDAMLYPVRIAEAVTGVVVVPGIKEYPPERVEIVAAVDLRQHLSLADGDIISLSAHERHSIKAIIFDVDGTLLNSLDGYRLAASRATQAHGYSVSLEHVRRALNTNQPFWDFILPPGAERDDDLIDELRAATMSHWPDALEEVVSVIPGSIDTLDSLRRAGIRLAIFTGSSGESFPPLRAAGILDRFEVIITGDDVDAGKPDPEGIRLCLDKLGLAPQEVAYVGDSCIDVTASHAAGVLTISVLTGAGDSASLSAAGTHHVLTSVARLPELFLET
jgi:phosphoglycolate phosphatase